VRNREPHHHGVLFAVTLDPPHACQAGAGQEIRRLSRQWRLILDRLEAVGDA